RILWLDGPVHYGRRDHDDEGRFSKSPGGQRRPPVCRTFFKWATDHVRLLHCERGHDRHPDFKMVRSSRDVHDGILATNSTYTSTQTVTLPDGITGDFFIVVETDTRNDVDEFFFEGDNT